MRRKVELSARSSSFIAWHLKRTASNTSLCLIGSPRNTSQSLLVAEPSKTNFNNSTTFFFSRRYTGEPVRIKIRRKIRRKIKVAVKVRKKFRGSPVF
ncbi:MAG: hypothetical protein ACJA2R_000189 [Saprospiraceae bacterium]